MAQNIKQKKVIWIYQNLKRLKKRKNKKKIILLSDDLRMSSGVGTMSREIVMGTIR